MGNTWHHPGRQGAGGGWGMWEPSPPTLLVLFSLLRSHGQTGMFPSTYKMPLSSAWIPADLSKLWGKPTRWNELEVWLCDLEQGACPSELHGLAWKVSPSPPEVMLDNCGSPLTLSPAAGRIGHPWAVLSIAGEINHLPAHDHQTVWKTRAAANPACTVCSPGPCCAAAPPHHLLFGPHCPGRQVLLLPVTDETQPLGGVELT